MIIRIPQHDQNSVQILKKKMYDEQYRIREQYRICEQCREQYRTSRRVGDRNLRTSW